MTVTPRREVTGPNFTRIAIVLLVAACSSVDAPADQGTAGAEAMPSDDVITTAIGSACDAGDGWQPTDTCPNAEGGAPMAIAVPDDYVDTPDLPPGIIYCMDPGGVFPDGYLTSNCKEHSDCPTGTLCDDVHCRLPCDLDSDCALPSICGAPAGKLQVRFCSCNACVMHTGR